MSLLAAYSSPWKGINTSVPSNHIDSGESPGQQNFTYYDGFLQIPSIVPFGLGTTPDNTPIRIVTYFQDSNNVLHHIVITDMALYDGVSNTSWGTQYLLPATGVTPANFIILQNILFFVNSTQYVLYYDGITASVQQATNLYGAKYIFELASSLCIANTVEASGAYIQRVRWAVAGNFTQWDPGTYTGAGFEDLLECPDGITGVMNTTPVAYIIRDNGVTQMIPTGVGTSAFSFNHLWASQRGIGDLTGATVANYGPVGFVVAADDVYVLTSSSYERIGTKVKNVLYSQLQTAINNAIVLPIIPVFAWVEPLMASGTPYLRYRIGINISGGISIWSFCSESYAWETEFYTGISLTGPQGYIGSSGVEPLLLQVPILPVQAGINFQMRSVFPPAQGVLGSIYHTGMYLFKTEFDPQDRSITVRQVKVRYQYLGNNTDNAVPVTITVAGMYSTALQTINLADPNATKQQLGGALPPSVSQSYYDCYFSPTIPGGGPLTDTEYQIQLTVAPPLNGGINSIRITDVWVFGDVGKEVVR